MAEWQNKIVGHGEESPEQLVANPRNWRIHPTRQQRALKGAIDDVGYISSVTVNKRTGYVLDGHLRVALAISSGQKQIPVEYVDISEEEEAEALAVLDPIAAMAATDRDQLGSLMGEIEKADEAVSEMLSELASAENVIASVESQESHRGTVEDRFEREYLSTDLRQIVLIMDSEEFEWAVAALKRLREATSAETNSDAVIELLKDWDRNNA